MAAVAYESFNRHAISGGLAIQTPKTCVNVAKEIIPKLVEEFGGRAVIKVPYSNKGEQVYTVANQAELSLFMATTHTYEKFLVSLTEIISLLTPLMPLIFF